MKAERQLEIIIYLLNHNSATAKQLSEKFEVSVRTIVRDMESISLAGVPIVSSSGCNGGYSIYEGYRLQNQFVKKDDFSLIVMALKSLSTGYKNQKLESITEKYLSLGKDIRQNVILDYSVSSENMAVQSFNKLLETAIQTSHIAEFEYRNVNGYVSQKRVHPLVLRFQWYAWYLFAFDTAKNDYRTYKIARIQSLRITDTKFENNYDVKNLVAEHDKNYGETCEKIDVWCQKEYISVIREYFPDAESEPFDNDGYIIHIYVPARERLWKALLLSLGDTVKVIDPQKYRLELIETAKKFILSNEEL